MINGIKVEERLQWDPSMNKILGLCWEHIEHISLDFCLISDVQAIVHGILRGEIHHASKVSHHSIDNVSAANSTGTQLCAQQVTVFLIGILTENEHVWGSRPFIAMGTCRWEGSERHTQLISTVIEACNAELSTIGCPLFSVTSDGEVVEVLL